MRRKKGEKSARRFEEVSEGTDALVASPSNSLEEVRVLTTNVGLSGSFDLIEGPVTCGCQIRQ